jgi:hypothetical protein
MHYNISYKGKDCSPLLFVSYTVHIFVFLSGRRHCFLPRSAFCSLVFYNGQRVRDGITFWASEAAATGGILVECESVQVKR